VLEDRPVVCIGPVTAEAARACGLTVAAVPAEYTVEGLTAVLCELFQNRTDRTDRSDPSDQIGRRGTPNA
jgi:uroporphyrinogen-III synthase